VLKNVIDWVSRPPEHPFDGKPIALMGASGGVLGTARAQYHLRHMFIFLNAHILNRPEVFIGGAPSKFDAEGKLTDQPTRDIVAAMLVAFKAWIAKLS
jgi:chromate reductase